MLYTPISRFLLGSWILRATNDKFYKEGYTSLKLNDDNSVKIKTIYQKSIIAEKKSISGDINIISNTDNTVILDIIYSKYNIYSHSIFGIQIPEFKSRNRTFNIKKRFEVIIMNNSLLASDTKTPLYYLFDLQVGQIKSPYIEVSFYTFIFSQIISILLNLIITDIINSI